MVVAINWTLIYQHCAMNIPRHLLVAGEKRQLTGHSTLRGMMVSVWQIDACLCLFMLILYRTSQYPFVFFHGFRFQFVTCHNYTSPFPSLGLDKVDKHGYVCTHNGCDGCFRIRSDAYQIEQTQDFKVVYSTSRCYHCYP